MLTLEQQLLASALAIELSGQPLNGLKTSRVIRPLSIFKSQGHQQVVHTDQLPR